MRQAVKTGAVRQRRRMQHGVAGRDRIDIGEISQAHRDQVAVGERGALGPAGGAAGIEEPGGVLRPALDQRGRLSGERAAPLGLAGDDEARELRQRAGQRRQRLGEIGADKAQPRAAMAEDVAELLAMQLGVDRHRHQPGMPDAEERLEIGGPVGHRDGDALARPIGGLARQHAGQRRGACGPLRVGRMHGFADRDRRTFGEASPVATEPGGEVHRPTPPGESMRPPRSRRNARCGIFRSRRERPLWSLIDAPGCAGERRQCRWLA